MRLLILKDSLRLWNRLLDEAIYPYIGYLCFAILMMSIVAIATAFSAYLLQPVVDKIFVAREAAMLLPVGGTILFTFFIKGIADFSQAATMSFVGLRIIANMQKRLFNHLMQLETPFFIFTSAGRLVAHFTSDVHLLRSAVSNTLTSLGKDFLTLISLVANMCVQDWFLTVISIVIFPAALLPIVRLGQHIRKITFNTQEHIGTFTTFLEQIFQSMRIVKSYGMENYENGKIVTLIEAVFRLTLRSQFSRALSSPLVETLGGITITVVILYGGLMVIAEQLTAGEFFSFIASLLAAYRPLKGLANLNSSLQEGLASAERLFSVFDTALPTVDMLISSRNDLYAHTLKIRNGSIRFSSVRFSHSTSMIPVLNDLSLEVPGGYTIALVGPSGAGKTTIFNLILRFWDVNSGCITIDGTDIRAITLCSLREQITLVSQEIVLFNDTIRANIGYGKPGASTNEIETAARYATAHAFIIDLPRGYDTVIGENGFSLSGGQRQKLAIARAILKNAPILLMDEATSSLDNESESYVQDTLTELMHTKTTLVIAHRLSTVVDADMIYVISQGHVVDMGLHQELLGHHGLYARLYDSQFFKQEAKSLIEHSTY